MRARCREDLMLDLALQVLAARLHTRPLIRLFVIMFFVVDVGDHRRYVTFYTFPIHCLWHVAYHTKPSYTMPYHTTPRRLVGTG